MTGEVRGGRPADLAALLDLDPQAADLPRLRARLQAALAGEDGAGALVIERDGQALGYAVLASFHGYPFLERIVTAPAHRRAGVASSLMSVIERTMSEDRLFVSTNESNQPMRLLLADRGYRVSGVVENLDPGDPELIYAIFRADLDDLIVSAR